MLLDKESDQASRIALARANFEVAALTRLVGRMEEVLAAVASQGAGGTRGAGLRARVGR